MEWDKVKKRFTRLTRGKGTRFIPSFRRSLRKLLEGLNTHIPRIAYPLSWPGNLRLVLTPHMTLAMSCNKNLNNDTRIRGGEAYFVQIFISRTFDFESADCYIIPDFIRVSSLNRLGNSYKASLSIQIVRSQLSTSWCTERRELYGWRWSATKPRNESYILLRQQSRRPARQYQSSASPKKCQPLTLGAGRTENVESIRSGYSYL